MKFLKATRPLMIAVIALALSLLFLLQLPVPVNADTPNFTGVFQTYTQTWVSAMSQRAFSATTELGWPAAPFGVKADGPITFTAHLDTKLSRGGVTYYNSTPVSVTGSISPGTGLYGYSTAWFVYIESGTYTMARRLRYDFAAPVTRLDNSQVVTRVILGDGSTPDNEGYYYAGMAVILNVCYLPGLK